jgi:tetratricopeptide (TPR) repeat protein
MAEGMLAMTEDMLDSAVNHFDIVFKLANETDAWDVLTIANYWTARCQRKQGRYESALLHVKRARELQRTHGHVQNEVPARVLESLILFETGDSIHAISNLRDAEAILMQTDDFITLGNIQSAYGRILQRELRYGQAIKHYGLAIEQFQKRDSKHSNVARAMVDMSFTRIQMARQFRRNIEGYSEDNSPNGQPMPVAPCW